MPEPIEDGVDQSSDGSEQPCVADLVGTQGMGKFVGHLHWRHDHTEQQQARDGVEEIEPTDGTQVGLNAEGTRSGCSFSAHVASGQSSVSGASKRIAGAQSEPLLLRVPSLTQAVAETRLGVRLNRASFGPVREFTSTRS